MVSAGPKALVRTRALLSSQDRVKVPGALSVWKPQKNAQFPGPASTHLGMRGAAAQARPQEGPLGARPPLTACSPSAATRPTSPAARPPHRPRAGLSTPAAKDDVEGRAYVSNATVTASRLRGRRAEAGLSH